MLESSKVLLWTYVPSTHPELSATCQYSQLKLFLPATIALSIRSLLLLQSHCFLLTMLAPDWRASLAQGREDAYAGCWPPISQVCWTSRKSQSRADLIVTSSHVSLVVSSLFPSFHCNCGRQRGKGQTSTLMEADKFCLGPVLNSSTDSATGRQTLFPWYFLSN